jgi:NAD(P)-dependent dehydrogenase (short-subunit alcohol dehydrogenase family)
MAQTARAAEEVAALTDRVDAVVCCAGRLSTTPEWTNEGLERTLALNYLSRFLLVRRILPALRRSSSGRVVLVANAGMYRDTLDLSDLQYRHGRPGLTVSGRTQFANDLFATELADRVRGTRIQVTCVHSGLVRTGVFRNAHGLPWIAHMVAPHVQRLFARPPAVGARTPVYLAQDPQASAVNGMFFGPRCKPRTVPPRALRVDRRMLLWEASEDLVRPYLPDGIDAC